MLSAEQRAFILKRLGRGDTATQIIEAATKLKEPFVVTGSQVAAYRKKEHIVFRDIVKRKAELGMHVGLALSENRVNHLQQLADMLEEDLLRKNTEFKKNMRWLERVKGIGSGMDYERVKEFEFNRAEYEQLRGIYDDIAKETGERVQRISKVEERADQEKQPLSIPAELIAPDFLRAYRDIKAHNHVEYIFSGGRGSTKSTFVSEAFIMLIVNNPEIHGLAMRQVRNTLRDSVYAQLQWSINEMGLSSQFKCTTSPLQIEYIPTHQQIYFRGADDPGKVKSIKPPFGYIAILWLEELDQFHGPEAIRKIEQSVIRGGELAWIFKSFNPPRTSGNWANKYIQIPKVNQYQHQSNYLTVPPEWLGQIFVDEAEHLKEVNPNAYDHEYLGIVNGTGGQVFDNVQFKALADRDIAEFDHLHQGVDWGYFPDPFAWGKMHYDAARMTLYIFDEYRAQKKGNKAVYKDLVEKKKYRPEDLIIADSAEPKSIADFKEYGANIRGTEKGADSVSYSIKWLQSLRAIIIDNVRCPFSAQEFIDYELEQDKDGNYISEYPDKNNHFIDMTRYATNLIWRRRGQ
jgi:PBSX family phage terminase large subunit